MEHSGHQPDGDLLALALPLRPLRDGSAPPGLAVAEHGLLFALLSHEAASVGDALHASGGERRRRRQPFALSPLLLAPDGPMAGELRSDRWYCVRIALLSRPMVELWHERLERALPARLHLGPGDPAHAAEQQCARDFVRGPGGPPLARRCTTYAELAQPSGPVRVDRWRLRFLTPSTFHPALAPEHRDSAPPGLCLPLPVPELILRGLAHLWCEWAPEEYRPLAAEPRVAELARYVQLEESRIAVSPVQVRGSVRMAFAGEAVLAYRRGRGERPVDSAARLRLLQALLGLASFAGVGIQTARGMGVVEVEPLSDRRPFS